MDAVEGARRICADEGKQARPTVINWGVETN
jgi:hypothetical protein